MKERMPYLRWKKNLSVLTAICKVRKRESAFQNTKAPDI